MVISIVFPHVSEDFACKYLMSSTIRGLLVMSNDDKDDSGKWLAILVELLSNIQDIRPKVARGAVRNAEENIGAKRGFMSSRYAQRLIVLVVKN